MAEELPENFNPAVEARRIASGYINRLGWAKEWKRTSALSADYRWRKNYSTRAPDPVGSVEENEDRLNRLTGIEDEAEGAFGREVDRWRNDSRPEAKAVLQELVNILGHRTDLGMIGKGIIQRLKRDLM